MERHSILPERFGDGLVPALLVHTVLVVGMQGVDPMRPTQLDHQCRNLAPVIQAADQQWNVEFAKTRRQLGEVA